MRGVGWGWFLRLFGCLFRFFWLFIVGFGLVLVLGVVFIRGSFFGIFFIKCVCCFTLFFWEVFFWEWGFWVGVGCCVFIVGVLRGFLGK